MKIIVNLRTTSTLRSKSTFNYIHFVLIEQPRNIVYGLMAQRPRNGPAHGSEKRAQGSENWEKRTQDSELKNEGSGGLNGFLSKGQCCMSFAATSFIFENKA